MLKPRQGKPLEERILPLSVAVAEKHKRLLLAFATREGLPTLGAAVRRLIELHCP